MKRILLVVYLLTISNYVFGQQNFFNVPSSEITRSGKWFFQQQANFYNVGVQSNSTLDYGLGNGFEVGVNYLGLSALQPGLPFITLNDTLKPYGPFLMLNAQKRFNLSEKFSLAVGGQVGFTTTRQIQSGLYGFSNLVFTDDALGLKTVLGLYYASNSFFGEGNRLISGTTAPAHDIIGLQFGMEKSILKDKLFFQADFISGQHNLGELVLGGAYTLSRNWILSAGYQIPTFGSKSIDAVVIEFTFNPKE